jgi:hypothetical protein
MMTTTAIPNPTDPRVEARVGQHIRQRLGIRALHEVSTVGKLIEQANLVQRLVRKTQDGTLGKETSESEGEDVGSYNVGDQYHIHQPPPQPPKTSMLPTLVAGVSTVAALALGGYQLYQALKPPQEQKVPADKDTDTRYSVEFGK